MFGRSHRLKSARLRERRRKVIIGKIVLILFCAGVLWGLIFWLTGLSAITINVVSVSGAVVVPPSDIASSTEKFLVGRYFFTVPRSNILFYPKGAVAEHILESYPRVKKAEVGFKNFNTINVALTERESAALWCRSAEVLTASLVPKPDDCFLVDEQGFIFDKFHLSAVSSTDIAESPDSQSASEFVKFYGEISSTTNPVRLTYSSAERFQNLLALAANLKAVGVGVVAFRERSDRDLDVEFSGGGRMVIGREPDTASVIENFQSVVSEPNFGGLEGLNKIDYIDMRFGNKVFYRLK